jgi:hypothetical protein
MSLKGSIKRTTATLLAVGLLGAAGLWLPSDEQTGTHSVTIQLPPARLAQPGFALSIDH